MSAISPSTSPSTSCADEDPPARASAHPAARAPVRPPACAPVRPFVLPPARRSAGSPVCPPPRARSCSRRVRSSSMPLSARAFGWCALNRSSVASRTSASRVSARRCPAARSEALMRSNSASPTSWRSSRASARMRLIALRASCTSSAWSAGSSSALGSARRETALGAARRDTALGSRRLRIVARRRGLRACVRLRIWIAACSHRAPRLSCRLSPRQCGHVKIARGSMVDGSKRP